jgi:hypothetical protein
MSGMRSFGMKQKREQRRRNHIAKDLASAKYRQRRKEPKRREKEWREKDGY